MQVYLVGGAVRDKLLGKTVKDNDYVVVGSTVEEMLAAGFKQVGADFPVFLHPITQQEYALARTERKSGQGYTGFSVHASPDVTIEEDLLRRDLTINAMAMEVNGLNDDTPKTGEIVDPYDGKKDIKNKRLKHVSAAFSEDPLRVLRVARFYGRFESLGFTIADDTFVLMKQLCVNNQLQHLTKERIWQESQRATMQNSPQVYWKTLYAVGALQSIMPSLYSAWQDNEAQDNTLHVLAKAAELNLTMPQRWAVLMSSFLEKQSSLQNIETALKEIASFHKQHGIPKAEQKLATLYVSQQHNLANINNLTAGELIQLVTITNAHKQPEILQKLLEVASIFDMVINKTLIDKAIASYHAIGMENIDSSLKGKEIGMALTNMRIEHLTRSMAND